MDESSFGWSGSGLHNTSESLGRGAGRLHGLALESAEGNTPVCAAMMWPVREMLAGGALLRASEICRRFGLGAGLRNLGWMYVASALDRALSAGPHTYRSSS